MNSSASPYSLVVPDSYDASHNTADAALHLAPRLRRPGRERCEGGLAGRRPELGHCGVGGRDGGCWNVGSDSSLVLAALDDVKTHLNVDPHRVTLGGYSSGGNLAYRTVFYNASKFAGIIAENTAPFYGTGSSQAASLAAAGWKLNIVHLAHAGDTTYPIAIIRAETEALKAAGFPATLLERPGTHWDSDSASSGTNYDLRTLLLPYLDAGWRSPD